jgi:hypothetical protein
MTVLCMALNNFVFAVSCQHCPCKGVFPRHLYWPRQGTLSPLTLLCFSVATIHITLLLVTWLYPHPIHFEVEDGGIIFLWNVGLHMNGVTAQTTSLTTHYCKTLKSYICLYILLTFECPALILQLWHKFYTALQYILTFKQRTLNWLVTLALQIFFVRLFNFIEKCKETKYFRN